MKSTRGQCCFRFATIVCLFSWTQHYTLFAQDISASDDEAKLDFFIEQFAHELKATALANLLARVETIDRRFDLPDAATRKLTVAAKGAASQYVEEYARGVERMALKRPAVLMGVFTINGRDVPGRVGDNQAFASICDIEVTIRDYGIWVQVREGNGASGTSINGGLRELFAQPVWVNTLEKVITPEQLKALDQEDQQRWADACSEMLLSYMHGHLALTDKQLPELRSWLQLRLRNQAKLGQIRVNDLLRPAVRHIGKDESGLEEILSEPQLLLWKDRRRQLELSH